MSVQEEDYIQIVLIKCDETYKRQVIRGVEEEETVCVDQDKFYKEGTIWTPL
jgi:hypothetical protein